MRKDSKAFFKDFVKIWSIVSAIFIAIFAAILIHGWTMIVNAAPAPAKTAGVLPEGSVAYAFSEEPNLVKASGNYYFVRKVYSIDDKPVLVVDIYYRQVKTVFKAVYYNALSADGAISFSERDIADSDNVIYVNDDDIGLKKGQIVYAEIQGLLDEVGY